jgi:hypothetical protein
MSLINITSTTGSYRSDALQDVRISELDLSAASKKYVMLRTVMLNEEKNSCTSEGCERRIDTMRGVAYSDWELTRKILAVAQHEGASIEKLDWWDNSLEFSIKLMSASIPQNIPFRVNRSLMEFPGRSAPFLADDALVLAHLEKSEGYDDPIQVFWIQWKDVGYRLTFEPTGGDNEESDNAGFTLTIEPLHLA